MQEKTTETGENVPLVQTDQTKPLPGAKPPELIYLGKKYAGGKVYDLFQKFVTSGTIMENTGKRCRNIADAVRQAIDMALKD